MVGRLAWLKSRLLWNGLKADRQRRIGLPAIMALLGWGAWELATMHNEAFSTLSPAAAGEFSAWAALAFFLIWVALPVVIFPIDEHLDPAQFAMSPISGPQLITGLAVASLVSPSIVMPAVALGVNVYEWRTAALAAVVASLLFLAMLVISGQLFTTAISALLRTRRGRDMSVFIVAGIGLTVFSAQAIVRTKVGDLGLERAVLANPITDWALIAPPVAAQRVVIEAAAGRPFAAIGFVLVSVLWILILALAWQRLLRWSLTTPEQSAGPRRANRSADGLAGRAGWGPTIIIARKELRFYMRDPRQRLVWTGAAIFVGLALASILVGTGTLAGYQTQGWLPMLAPVLVLFVGLPIALNLFGWERNAASFLFVLPIRPRRMLLGKNLAAALALTAETAVMAIAMAALSGSWGALRLVPILGFCAICCQLAVGNLVSVITPLRLPREGTDVFAQATEQGCLAIGAQLVSFMTIGLLLVPPASVATLVVGYGQVVPAWVLVLFAPAWGLALYGISMWLSGKVLERRLPEVAQWVQVV
jgi:ABC-2 type transport system permease protein